MRIIAGEFRGRVLRLPTNGRLRPTADRVREAWFSILASELDGARVVDLFAGSGALGLEALSRGADHVHFVEISRASLKVLRANVAALDAEDRVRIHQAYALRFTANLDVGTYDVALADPPYRTGQVENLVGVFRRRPFARLLGVEHSVRVDLAGDDRREYGDVALTFFRSR